MIDPSIDKHGKNHYKIMEKIYDAIRVNITSIIFESMISRGTLSYMVAETDLTDTTVYDISQQEAKKKLVAAIASKRFYNGNPYEQNSYYYLTNKPFNMTGTFNIKVEDKPDKFDYFKICSTVKTAWYVSTTFHWVAQIGFCHRFINNRVNYVTGGTGAGKSTQVPKLYMYYLKAIDRIDDPTVVITVPRTNVATGVSNFVSQEMAVPLKEVNEFGEEEKTKNQYVQYKYQRDNNVDDGIYPKIRFVTDGSVLQDAKDPMFKIKRLVDNNYVYTRSDRYNVVIIDEAHEHNANMDMILTLMKNAAYYNNKLRLVIMSATMDADEPIYRRFYRSVNDNRKYPLSRWIKSHKLDRINTERRFHISPPDETTRFKIDEFYRPNESADDLVVEIINNSTTGDILLFRPGVKDIDSSLKALNKKGILPDNVIALPYHAQLNDAHKRVLDSIDKNLKNIMVSKEKDFSSASYEEINGDGKGPYTRCVLVATNIAEASISIATLRYVVETGLEKTMRFDFERRSNILTTNYITLASAIQRRGRVGRVAPGTVYYVYPKGKLDKNIKQFNISVQDVHISIFLDLLRDLSDVPIFTDMIDKIVTGFATSDTFKKVAELKDKYLSDLLDPKTKKTVKQNLRLDQKGNIILDKKNIETLIEIDYKDHFTKNVIDSNSRYANAFIKGIIDIISDHYMSDGVYYDYYGSDDQNDYEYDKLNNDITKRAIYFSGFDADRLTDSMGNFYIVHPDELVIKRNIAGEVVDSDQYAVITKKISDVDYVTKMMSNKIIVFWESLINKNLIGVTNGSENKEKVGGLGSLGKRRFYKTKIGNLMQYCIKNFTEFDLDLLNMLFYGYGLSKDDNEFEKVLNVVSFLDILESNPFVKSILAQDLFSKNADPVTEKIDYRTNRAIEKKLHDSLSKTYGKGLIKSDLNFINNVCESIDDLFKASNIEFNLFKSSYLKADKFLGNDILGISTGFPKDLAKKTKKDIEKRQRIMSDILLHHAEDLTKFIESPTIKDLLTQTGINYKLLSKFVYNREDIRRMWNDIVYNLKNTGEDKDTNLKDIRTILKPRKNYMDSLGIDVVKGALMMTKPYGIYKKITNTSSSYVLLFNPHIDNIVSVSQNNTFVEAPFYQDYLLNVSEKLEYGIISILTQIKKDDLMFVANVYNPREMRRKFSKEMITSQKQHIHNKKYIDEVYPNVSLSESLENPSSDITPFGIDMRRFYVPEHVIATTNINTTISAAESDIDKLNSSDLWAILQKLDANYEDYSKLLLLQ
jgi:hypothetical protein